MRIHLDDDQIQDYLDGVLAADEIARTEAHLATCDACSRATASLRTLVEEVAALPRGIAPGRDLRPGIHAALAAATSDGAGLRHAAARWQGMPELIAEPTPRRELRPSERTVRSVRFPLLAAGIALVVLSSSLTVVLVRRGSVADPPTIQAHREGFIEEFRTLEAHYIAATGELERVLSEERASLSAETVRILEHSLAVIDGALAEAGAALRTDPSNEALSDMMLAAYEKKLDLLRRAAEFPAERRGGV